MSEGQQKTFLTKAFESFYTQNKDALQLQNVFTEISDTMLEFTFALCDPSLVKQVLKYVPDEQEAYDNMRERFQLLILLDYIADAKADGTALEDGLRDLARKIESAKLSDTLQELASYLICEFKTQICIAHLTSDNDETRSLSAMRDKVSEIFGDSNVTANDLLSSKSKADMVTASLLAKNKEELESVFDSTAKGKIILDNESLSLLIQEHPWEEFINCLRKFLEQFQTYIFGPPKLLKYFEKKQEHGKNHLKEDAPKSKESKPEPPFAPNSKTDLRVKELQKTFFEVGGTKAEWEEATLDLQSNMKRFEKKIRAKIYRKGLYQKRKTKGARIVIPFDEQYDDTQLDDEEIIGLSSFPMPLAKKRVKRPHSKRSKRKKRLRYEESILEKVSEGNLSEEESTTDQFTDQKSLKNDQNESDHDDNGQMGKNTDKRGMTGRETQRSRQSSSTRDSVTPSSSLRANSLMNVAKSEVYKTHSSISQPGDENINIENTMAGGLPPNGSNSRRKKRVFWSDRELQALIRGVKEFGVGNWTKILKMSDEFHPSRDSVALKDKWRNYTLKEEISPA